MWSAHCLAAVSPSCSTLVPGLMATTAASQVSKLEGQLEAAEAAAAEAEERATTVATEAEDLRVCTCPLSLKITLSLRINLHTQLDAPRASTPV